MATNTDITPADAPSGSLAQFGPALPSTDAMGRLEEWVVAASRASALVSPLIGSAFVPDAYKPKIDPRASDEDKAAAWETARANATAAVLLGLSIGLDPLTALQQIYLVKGRPGMYSKMKVALLMARGFKIWTETLTDDVAVVAGIRPGDEVRTVEVTMEMAKKAGWLSNEAYSKTPQDMLWARAAGRWCDRYGGDRLQGLASVEDIPDVVQVEAQVGSPVRRVTAADLGLALRTETAAQSAAVDAELAADHAARMSTPAPSTVDAGGQTVIDIGDAPAAISDEQRATLSELLRQTNRAAKSKAVQYIAGVIGHPVDGPQDLTTDQADDVIRNLRADVEQNQAETDPGGTAKP